MWKTPNEEITIPRRWQMPRDIPPNFSFRGLPHIE
jgi:hypothetical protein